MAHNDCYLSGVFRDIIDNDCGFHDMQTTNEDIHLGRNFVTYNLHKFVRNVIVIEFILACDRLDWKYKDMVPVKINETKVSKFIC